MQARAVMAIDQGTTGSTVIVFDRRGRVIGRANAEFGQRYPRSGWVEHDALEIWRVTRDAAARSLRAAQLNADNLAAIGIVNQRETCLLWDRKNGRPLGPALVWQDRRTADLCRRLKQEGLEPEWQEKTGLLIDPYFSATKAAWMLEHYRGAAERAQRGELAFGTIDTWLAWQLTGGEKHLTDPTNASRTMLYNIREQDWDDAILERLAIPRSILPRVTPSCGVFGQTNGDRFFGARVPLAAIAGDQQAALFGQLCFEEGQVKNTYGTGSFLLMPTGRRPVASRRLLTTVAWQLEGQAPEYALEGSVFVTGAAVQWLRDGLGLIASAAETESLAESLSDNGDVFFVPALAGLGAPHWDPYARGLVIGLSRGSTRAHLARATLESIAYQTRDTVEAMTAEAGTRLNILRADGGATANRWLMQFQSDILGTPLEVPEIAETTALGAAYMAGIAVEWWARDSLAAQRRIAFDCEPRMPRREADRLYRRWQQALGRAGGWIEPGEA